MKPVLVAESLHWQVSGKRVVRGVDMALHEGECLGLIGPNGCGKSSLLRMMYRVIRPSSGHVHLAGQDAWGMSVREFAKQVAVLTQEYAPVFDMSVHDTVMMGRIAHQSAWSANSARDKALVHDSLERMGCLHLADNDYATLSGGEKQRVLLARALTQEPQCLLLDEPTNHLDVRFQHELMELVRGAGRSTLVVLHDLNIAAQYCDQLCLMHEGRVVAQGESKQVLTPGNIAAVYGMHAVVDAHPFTGKPRVTFAGKAESSKTF